MVRIKYHGELEMSFVFREGMKLHIKLTDDTGRTVVQRSVTSLRQALEALKNYTVTDVDVCYNVDVTDKIHRLALKINEHFLK